MKMTGKKLIEKLNSMIGKEFNFFFNDAIFSGKLEIFRELELETYYTVGDVMFVVRNCKKYKEEQNRGLKNCFIDEVK